MKKTISLVIALVLVFSVNAQNLPFNSSLKPFYHGVASGDPMEDRVIIWTRITPESDQTINGNYIIARDTLLRNIIKTGAFSTNAARDYTVKIDVTGLQPNTTYYYAFTALGKRSAIGRTKTTPSVSSANLTDVLKFAVVSCSNYEGGYFNAYNQIAKRNDLNAVIHLGDYIYEYQAGTYKNSSLNDPNRINLPPNELLNKGDYRIRYSQYRLDNDVQKIHQQHPFIAVWDDHETANNAYLEGAQNHSAGEGDWNIRKKDAREAYFEWLPIREKMNDTTIYRAFSYGKLLDLFMLDTRLDGRQKQPESFDTPDNASNPRRMISPTQMQWLINNLKNAQGRWKVIGNQVIMSDLNVGIGATDPKNYTQIGFFENLFNDGWEAYKLQRNTLLDSIQKNEIKNIVIVSGDSHATWAFDMTKQPVLYPLPQFSYIPQPNLYNPTTKQGYTPETGEGSLAVEFCTPSVSAANFDETIGVALATRYEEIVNKPQPQIEGNPNYNPHLKLVDLDRHGYMVLDVRADSVQTDYFYVPSVIERTNTESWGGAVSSINNANRISKALPTKAASPKAVQDIPAPTPSVVSPTKDVIEPILFSIYPNPARQALNIQYGIQQNATVEINIMSIDGKTVKSVLQQKNQTAGVYQLFNIPISDLKSGIYMLHIKANNSITTRKVVIE